MGDDGIAVIPFARASYLVKLLMQKLLKALARAADAWMMKLNLEMLELFEKRIHGRRALVEETGTANGCNESGARQCLPVRDGRDFA